MNPQRMEKERRPLALFQLGQPPADLRHAHGEQADWITAALAGTGDRPLQVIRPFLDEVLPAPGTLAGAVFSGSWSMVTDREAWSERTAQWIREAMAVELPLLGICYGHQLMAHALGGVVKDHPQGREVGIQHIHLSAAARHDPLLADFPDTFTANLTHQQSVLVPPPGAVVLGHSAHDPHQILRYGPHALSVQFHPEFFPELMRACLMRREDVLCREGFDVPAICAALEPTPQAREVLRQFAAELAIQPGPTIRRFRIEPAATSAAVPRST